MVKMRLRRAGAKKQPFYRVIVADERSPRGGRFIDEIGYYNPLTNPADVKINAEKATKQALFRNLRKKVDSSHKMRLTLKLCCATLCELTCLWGSMWRKPKLEYEIRKI